MHTATARDSFVSLSNSARFFPFLLNQRTVFLKHLFHLCDCFFEGTKSIDTFLISFLRDSTLLDKFLISILKISAFLVDFYEIIIVFTAINTSAAAEVIKQYLIIFCPLLRDIMSGIYLSNLDQLSNRITYRGADNKLFF